jgi:hypothetical protein
MATLATFAPSIRFLSVGYNNLQDNMQHPKNDEGGEQGAKAWRCRCNTGLDGGSEMSNINNTTALRDRSW